MANADRDGIVRDEKTGELFIPASQRPDGSWRKPRKVRDGYVPQEEVPVYENKGVQWLKSKPSLPPGMNFVDSTQTRDDSSTTGMSKSAKKNAKRKEKKKAQQRDQDQPSSVDKLSAVLSDTAITVKPTPEPSQEQSKEDIEKKLRNLKKKLRQIEDLQKRIDSGELKEPEKEQLQKIAKRADIESEIEDLELELVDV